MGVHPTDTSQADSEARTVLTRLTHIRVRGLKFAPPPYNKFVGAIQLFCTNLKNRSSV